MGGGRPGCPKRRACAAATATAAHRPPPTAFWAVFTVLFFGVRLPFLFAGYGADTDAYRVALSGRVLWSTGEYLPSRLPGYPVHELATALLLWGGPPLTNLATAVVAFAGVLIFDRIVARLGVPGRRWLLVAMGFTPWLLVNSTNTLDYHWALTLMLGSYGVLAGASGRVPRAGGERVRDLVLAGVLLGLAVGCRITAAALLLPMVVLINVTPRPPSLRGKGAPTVAAVAEGSPFPRREGGRGVRSALYAGSAFLTALLCYLPVLWTYGLGFRRFADSAVSPDVVIQMVGQRGLGVVGALVALGVLALQWRRVAALPRLLRTDVHVLVWALTVAIYAVIYLRLPVDAGYLIPIYPFAFLLVARVLAGWALPVVVVAAIGSGFVDLTIQGVHNFSPTAAAREVRPSWREATLFDDYLDRTRWRRYAEEVGRVPVPEHSVVLTGGAFPDVAVLNWDRFRYAIVRRDLTAVSMISDNGALWDDRRDVVYLAVSERAVLDRFRAEGYAIYRAEPVGRGWRVRLVAE